MLYYKNTLNTNKQEFGALTVQRLRVGKVLFELLIQVFADTDVLEHAL